MVLPAGFSQKKLSMWSMRRKGSSLAEIGRKLGISRQAVHKAMKRVDNNVSRTLEGVATAAKIEISQIDPKLGILLGYSHENKDKTVITFSARHGAQIWHNYIGECGECKLHKKCKTVILDEAQEREITLSEEEKKKTPAEIARIVFSKLFRGEW